VRWHGSEASKRRAAVACNDLGCAGSLCPASVLSEAGCVSPGDPGRAVAMPSPGPRSLIDRVDDLNRPIGTVLRGEAFAVKANFRTVHVLVFSQKGSLLLQQLAPDRKRNPLKWGSSVAGYLYAGETYEQAAKRRLEEELGLFTKIEFIGVMPMYDEGIKKFVGVYTTISDHPQIAEPDHIAEIEYRDVGAVVRDMTIHPERYTETLREVMAYWLGRGRPGLPGR